MRGRAARIAWGSVRGGAGAPSGPGGPTNGASLAAVGGTPLAAVGGTPLDLALENATWRRTLIALTLVLGLVGAADVRNFAVHARPLFVVYVVCHVVGLGAWIAWWRGVRRSVAAWTVYLTGAATFLPVTSAATALGFLSLVLGSGLLGLAGQFRRVAAASVLVGVAESVLSVRLGEAVAASILSGLLAALLLGLLAGSGALLRRVQEAQSVAVERGARIAQANERLRATMSLERELVLAQERARSARELHDGLGHRLTLTSMSLQFALRMREKNPDLAWAEVDTAAATTARALEVITVWGRALDPPSVGPRGAASFDAIADAFRGTGLDVRVTNTATVDLLAGPVGVFLTRLVQEGLTNVLRHAEATQVDVAIRQTGDRVWISLRDNGVGQTEPREGFGLRSLRERAEALGGELIGRPVAPAVSVAEAGDPGGAGPRESGWELTAVIPLEAAPTDVRTPQRTP